MIIMAYYLILLIYKIVLYFVNASLYKEGKKVGDLDFEVTSVTKSSGNGNNKKYVCRWLRESDGRNCKKHHSAALRPFI